MRTLVGDEDEEVTPLPLPETVDLPWSLATCLDLWKGWNEHGVMAVSGGYFDQPRQWIRMIRLFNRIHNPINKAHFDALFPNRNTEPGEVDRYRDLLGEDVRDGWEGLVGE